MVNDTFKCITSATIISGDGFSHRYQRMSF